MTPYPLINNLLTIAIFIACLYFLYEVVMFILYCVSYAIDLKEYKKRLRLHNHNYKQPTKPKFKWGEILSTAKLK